MASPSLRSSLMIAGRATLVLPVCRVQSCGQRRQMEETMRFALIMLALFLGAGPASAWEEYVYLDQGVAIQFPAKPQAMASTYDSIFAKRLSSMVYSVEDDHVLYKLTVIDLTNRPDKGSSFLNEVGYE